MRVVREVLANARVRKDGYTVHESSVTLAFFSKLFLLSYMRAGLAKMLYYRPSISSENGSVKFPRIFLRRRFSSDNHSKPVKKVTVFEQSRKFKNFLHDFVSRTSAFEVKCERNMNVGKPYSTNKNM